MDWIDPKDILPPQGKKILYFRKGDIYVVQRFGEYWLPIPFHDSRYSKEIYKKQPEYWADIYCPSNYTGKIHVYVDDEMHDIDSLEKHHPSTYLEMLKFQIPIWEIP